MGSKPAAIRDVLQDVFSRLESEKDLSQEAIESSWKGLAGAGGHGHSKPMSLRKGVLTVFVDSSVWMQELSLRKRALVKGLKRRFGKDRISEIHFKMGEF